MGKFKFSKKSKEKLETTHKDIQAILNELIQYYDFSVLEGIRTTERQIELYKQGRTRLNGVTRLSKHQSKDGISKAVDIMPYQRGTNAFSGKEKDARRFYTMMGMVKAVHARLQKDKVINCDIRFGLDWNSNDRYDDQTFDDLPHFEITPYHRNEIDYQNGSESQEIIKNRALLFENNDIEVINIIEVNKNNIERKI